MLAFATLLAAMLPAAVSNSCAATSSSQAQFVAGQVQLIPPSPAGGWAPPVELASAAMVCDPERGQLVLWGVDAKRRGHLWVLQPDIDGWLVLREMDGLPRIEAAALAEGRLILGVMRRRDVSELWLMPASGKARPDVRQLGAPVTAIALSGDRSSWWIATGTELRGFARDDGSTKESFVFPAPILAVASVSGSDFVAVAWEGTVVLVDPRDRPARGVLPWRAQSPVPGAVARIAMSSAGDAMHVLLRLQGSEQELALLLRPGPAAPTPPSTPPAPAPPSEVRRTDPAPMRQAESHPAPSPTPAPSTSPQEPAPPIKVEPAPVPAAPARSESAPPRETPPPPQRSPIVPPAATAPPACTPDIGELGVIAGRIDDPAQLAAELIVHGPDNALREAARVVLKPSVEGICFRVAGLKPGRYRLQVMGRNGSSLRTRPPFVILDFTPERSYPAHFTVDGRL